MKLDKLSNLSIAFTAFVAAFCFVSESAHAIIKLRHSGSPNGGASFFEFNIDPSVPNTSPTSNIGIFENAVQDAKYRCSPSALFFCNGNDEIILNQATLKASFINSSDDFADYPGGDFIGGVKYESRIQAKDSPDFFDFLVLVKPDTSVDILNSLSNLSNIIISGDARSYVGVRTINRATGFFIGSSGSLGTIDVPVTTPIPEHNMVASLLSAGFISILVLRRKSSF